MNTITIEAFKKIYLDREVKLLIDVRTPAEFEEIHVEGATNLPLGEFNLEKVEELCTKTGATEVYLICRSGGRSQQALEKLTGLGFKNAISVLGGTSAADANNIPTTKPVRKVISLERQVRIAAGLLVLIGTIAAILLSIFFLILPLFVGAGLIFAGITDWCGMGLLLAKFPWNQAKLSCSKS
jgi:rhodanese-related sulfurtransferase